MQKKFEKGFTLVELLVVIAIIGILASVVLASLNTARSKGSDAAIKSNLNNARAAAELFYDSNGNSYDGVCTSASGISLQIAGAESANGAIVVTCNDDANEYAVESQLVSSAAGFYCVDYKGNAATSASTATSATDGDIDCD